MRRSALTHASVAGMIAFVFQSVALAGVAIVYVDDDAPPGGDGLAWNTAFTFLRDALAFANDWQNDVTEIRVAQGVYKPDQDEVHPDGTGDSNISFWFGYLGDYELLGGFAGLGTVDPDARDVVAFPTILSGDLDGDDGPGFVNYDDNSNVLVKGNTKLDGCTIRSAMVGMHSENIQVTTCEFLFNSIAISSDGVTASYCHFDANEFGVIVYYDGSGQIDHCQFTNHVNRALHCGEASASVSNCTFAFNAGGACSTAAGGGTGFTNCDFLSNSAEFGGVIRFSTGAPAGASGYFTNCRFISNSADKGGVLYAKGDDQAFHGASFINCVFFENTATEAGGAIYGIWNRAKLMNCTLVHNSAPIAGAIYTAGSSTLKVRNSIIKSNPGGSFGGPGVRKVFYSNIGGGHSGTGNINANPKFKNAAIGDLRLKSSSPCIDAGKNSYVSDVEIDLDGNPRFVDRPQTPDTGAGTPPIVDIGAYEFQP